MDKKQWEVKLLKLIFAQVKWLKIYFAAFSAKTLELLNLQQTQSKIELEQIIDSFKTLYKTQIAPWQINHQDVEIKNKCGLFLKNHRIFKNIMPTNEIRVAFDQVIATNHFFLINIFIESMGHTHEMLFLENYLESKDEVYSQEIINAFFQYGTYTRTFLHNISFFKDYIMNNKLNIIKTLLMNGANANVVINKHNVTPLMVAIANNYLEMTQLLLQYGANLNALDVDANSALILAVYHEYEPIVTLLLQYDASKTINNKTKNANSALSIAINRTNLSICELLLQYGADVNLKIFNNFTPLMLAIYKRKIEIVKLLLTHGPNINLKGKDNVTPLIMAVKHGNTEMVQLLLNYNIKKNISFKTKNGDTALTMAIQGNYLAILKLLLTHGANVNAVDSNGFTPLMVAVYHGHLEMVDLLLQYGAKETINNQVKAGDTVLTLAVHSNCQFSILQKLIIAGADVSFIGEENMNILQLAVEQNNEELVTLLLKYYAIESKEKLEIAPTNNDLYQQLKSDYELVVNDITKSPKIGKLKQEKVNKSIALMPKSPTKKHQSSKIIKPIKVKKPITVKKPLTNSSFQPKINEIQQSLKFLEKQVIKKIPDNELNASLKLIPQKNKNLAAITTKVVNPYLEQIALMRAMLAPKIDSNIFKVKRPIKNVFGEDIDHEGRPAIKILQQANKTLVLLSTSQSQNYFIKNNIKYLSLQLAINKISNFYRFVWVDNSSIIDYWDKKNQLSIANKEIVSQMLSLADLEVINDNLKLIANFTSKNNQLELSTDMKDEINNLDNDLAKISITTNKITKTLV